MADAKVYPGHEGIFRGLKWKTPCEWALVDGTMYLYDAEGRLIMAGPVEEARKHWVLDE